MHDEIFIGNINEYLNYVESVGTSLWTVVRMYFMIRTPDIFQKLVSFFKTDNFIKFLQKIDNPTILPTFWSKLKDKDKKKIRRNISDSNILLNYWNQADFIFRDFLLQNLKDPSSVDLSVWEEKNKQVGIDVLSKYLISNNLDSRSLKAGTIAIKNYYRRLKDE